VTSKMRVGLGPQPRFVLSALSLLLLLVVASASAQKVETKYDKAANFAVYKHYTWGKNYLLTHQRPEVQAKIDQAIVDSLNRQLQAKGFLLDEKTPDFRVKYEAGGLAQAATSTQPDLLYPGPPGPTFSSDSLGGIPLDVWTSTLTKMRLTVTDATSDKEVWQALVSQKLRDPQKFLNDLNKNIDNVMAKALKGFPPGTKKK
jgi:hypothetical protein